MSKLILTASLLAVFATAACSPAAAGPTAVPSVSPAPSAPPSAEPPASDPPETPAPTPTPTPKPPARPAADPTDAPEPTETPDPAIVEFTPGEIFLSDGIVRDVSDCEAVRGEVLPKTAVAGIECLGESPYIARVGFYLFENDQEMFEHYMERMAAEGVEFDSGSCFDGEGDYQYIPGPDEIMSRNGCFITAQGVANYRLLLPGAHVYVGIVGHNIDPVELEDFAFLGGTHDTPSFPTIWSHT
jgi:hypothetical protein